MFLADFSTTGFVDNGGVGGGAIYQFDFSVPEPATFGLAAAALLAGLLLRRASNRSESPGR